MNNFYTHSLKIKHFQRKTTVIYSVDITLLDIIKHSVKKLTSAKNNSSGSLDEILLYYERGKS